MPMLDSWITKFGVVASMAKDAARAIGPFGQWGALGKSSEIF